MLIGFLLPAKAENKGLVINTDFIKVALEQGASAKEVFEIINNENEHVLVSVQTEELSGFATLSETSFLLEPGERRTIKLAFSIKENAAPDAYAGKIFVQTEKSSETINIITEVKEKNAELGVSVNLLDGIILPGEYSQGTITILNSGEMKPLQVTVYYAIKNFEHELFSVKEESLAVDDELSITRSLKTSTNIPAGKYVHYARVSYENVVSASAEAFEISLQNAEIEEVNETETPETTPPPNFTFNISQFVTSETVNKIVSIGGIILTSIVGIGIIVLLVYAFLKATKRAVSAVKNSVSGFFEKRAVRKELEKKPKVVEKPVRPEITEKPVEKKLGVITRFKEKLKTRKQEKKVKVIEEPVKKQQLIPKKKKPSLVHKIKGKLKRKPPIKKPEKLEVVEKIFEKKKKPEHKPKKTRKKKKAPEVTTRRPEKVVKIVTFGAKKKRKKRRKKVLEEDKEVEDFIKLLERMKKTYKPRK
jgi:hypothetical protein